MKIELSLQRLRVKVTGDKPKRMPGCLILILRLLSGGKRTTDEIVDGFGPSPRARANRARLTESRLHELFDSGHLSRERRMNGCWALTDKGRAAIEDDNATAAKTGRIPGRLEGVT